MNVSWLLDTRKDDIERYMYIHTISCLQRTIERWRRGGKGHRLQRDAAGSCFQNLRFLQRIVGAGYRRTTRDGASPKIVTMAFLFCYVVVLFLYLGHPIVRRVTFTIYSKHIFWVRYRAPQAATLRRNTLHLCRRLCPAAATTAATTMRRQWRR